MTELPLIARVECRSEARGEDRPVAVWIGGRRFGILALSEEHMAGPLEAGGRVRHVAEATLEDGRRLRMERRLPEGPWRVRLLEPAPAGPLVRSSPPNPAAGPGAPRRKDTHDG